MRHFEIFMVVNIQVKVAWVVRKSECEGRAMEIGGCVRF
jgi:hypothetical protein